MTNWGVKTKEKLPSNFVTENELLKIRNLEKSNEGQYECKIVGETKTERIIVNLIVKSKLNSFSLSSASYNLNYKHKN